MYAIIISVVLAVVVFNIVEKKQKHIDTIQYYQTAIKDCESTNNQNTKEAGTFVDILGRKAFEGMEETRLQQIFSNTNGIDFLVKTEKELLDDIDPNTYDYAYQMKCTSNFFIIKDKRVVKLKYYWYDNSSR